MTLDEYFIALKKRINLQRDNEHVLNVLENIIKLIKSDPDLSSRITNQLGLLIKNNEEMNESSSPVCYANSPDVREEFRTEIKLQSTSQIDILHYYYYILNSVEKINLNFKDLAELKFPDSKDDFFTNSRKGKELLEQHFQD